MRRVIIISVLLTVGFLFHESTHVTRVSSEPSAHSGINREAAADRSVSAGGKLPGTGACTVLMDYFRELASSASAAVTSGQKQGEPPPCELSSNQADVVIAMAPHPVNSGLALTFDREIESIQRAAASAGYDFHQHYFPWVPPANLSDRAESKGGGDRGMGDREPGLLLFRGMPDKLPLVVLMLPETPSGYIDPVAFQVSMAYARHLGQRSGAIRILGPFASGTVTVLRKLIDEWRSSNRNQSVEFDIISGSATAKTTLQHLSRNAPYIAFHSVVDDDDATLTAFRNYFGRNARMVLLSESGTAYGGQRLQIPSISFPREMSRLRNAYGQLPGPSHKADTQAPSPTARLLPLDLRDSVPAQDMVRKFSGSQLAASQESVLLNIAEQLRRERVQYAGILATDVLDGIFLAKFLGSSCPNVRLFTLDPDLLFARAAEELPFTGLVSLGTYALLPREEPLTEGTISHSVVHFPSQAAAGAYDAFRALLNRAGLCCANGPLFRGHLQAGVKFKAALKRDRDRKRVSFHLPAAYTPRAAEQWMLSVSFQGLQAPWKRLDGEWAATVAGDDHVEVAFDSSNIASEPPSGVLTTVKVPPLWINVLSRTGYWPVASVQPEGFPPLVHPPVNSGFEQPSGVWKFVFLAVSLFALGYAAAVLRTPSGDETPRIYAPAYISPRAPSGQGSGWYVLIATLSLSFIYATMIVPIWLLRTDLANPQGIAGAILFAAVILGLVAAGGFSLRQLTCQRQDRITGAFGVGCGIILAIVIFHLASLLSLGDEHYQKFFGAYRTFDPLSGVSPSVPMALMAAVVFCWATIHAKRLWMTSFKIEQELPPIQPGSLLEPLRCAVEDAIEQPFFNNWRVAGATLILVTAVVLHGYVFDSFESPAYTRLYAVLAGIGGAVLFLTWSRFLLIWMRFSKFLDELARHPIRSALAKLPRTHSWSAIFQSPDSLAPKLWADRASDCWRRLHTGAMAAAAGDRSPATAGVTAPVSTDLSANSMKQCIEIVSVGWARGRSESWSRTKSERSTHLSVSAIDRSDEREIVAGEFVAQPFHRFIIYVLLHMRNLVFFISAGFGLITLSLFSFPFQSHHLLSGTAITALIVLGASLVYVFAEVDKNAVLSWMNETTPGEVGSAFYVKVLSYGAIPLITLLSTQFPSISRTLLDWVQPFSQTLK